jgi:hypothetical protein
MVVRITRLDRSAPPRTGRKPLLGNSELTELDGIVETQPGPVKDGVVRCQTFACH